MRFESSAVRNFRNLGAARIPWEPGLNLILGPNGAGKTNLLESLNLLSGWGPFTGRAGSAVAWDSKDGRALLAARAVGEREIEISALLSSRMTLKADGVRVSGSELRVLLPTLSFLPTDIGLIDGSPSVRRLFLDRLCALCIPPYARRLSEYRQLVRHRVALLRQGRSPRGTTLPFARLGGWILESRRRVLALMADRSDGEGGLLPFPVDLRVEPEVSGNGNDYLLAALEASEERERHARRPLVGPHRDDLSIVCMGRAACGALSRGQKRRLVLSLILMAGRFVERYLRVKPILLFDDLGAELDAAGRAAAGTALLATGWQVFVTGTEHPFPELAGGARVHHLTSKDTG